MTALRTPQDIDTALKEIRNSLRDPSLSEIQRAWLNGMLRAAGDILGILSDPLAVPNLDTVRHTRAEMYGNDYSIQRTVGGWLAFTAWVRFDQNNPPNTPSSKIVQMLLEGKLVGVAG